MLADPLPMPQPTPADPFPNPNPNPHPPTWRPSCPTCGVPVAGLLAGCGTALCLTAYLDDDARFDNQDW